MREIVPRNSELVGMVPTDTYEIHYKNYKGLAIDLRTEDERNTTDVVPYRVRRPYTTFIGSTAVGYLGINYVADSIVDMPLTVQSSATFAAYGLLFVKYLKDCKDHDKLELQKRLKRNEDIFAIAGTNPNVYFIPPVSVSFRVEEGEELDDALQELLRTPNGRQMLDTMSIDVDDSRGISAKERELRQKIDGLYITNYSAHADSDPELADTSASIPIRRQIQELKYQLERIGYSYKYGENYGSDITLDLTFDPASSVNDTLTCAINKGQLISDATTELSVVALLTQRYETLEKAIREVPYDDRKLHKDAVDEIKKKQKELGLQILTEVAKIKKKGLDQQEILLQGYANGEMY